MRKTFLSASLMFLLISTCALAVNGDMGGTDPNGSPEKPYLIEDLADFDTFADPNNAATYWVPGVHTKLMTDIDLAGRTYTTAVIAPDGGDAFEGVFDGNSHTIGNLTIDTAGLNNDYLGLFGKIEGPNLEIKHLGIENVDISVISLYTGALVGQQLSGTINNCYSTGSITATPIEHTVGAGGLVGQNYDGVIVNCYSTSSVVASSHSNAYAGGLVGTSSGIISNSYSTGSASASGGYYSSRSGGLVGWNGGSIIGSYSTGSADGTGDYHGGLVGTNSGPLISCYSTGNADSGLVGNNSSFITNCYSTGNAHAGCGLVGQAYSTSQIIESFWDIQSSGTSSSEGGEGLYTSAMQNINTFLNAGWDFTNENSNGTSDFWEIPQNGGYPILCGISGTIPALDGSGTNEDPYVITDANDLGMIWCQPASRYILVNDVNLAGIQWNKAVIPAFCGLLDGKFFRIQNLSINGSGFLGLIGKMYQTGEIKNLGIDNAAIYARGDYIGGITGNNLGVITSCHWTGAIDGYGVYVGGAAGANSAIITNCYSTGTIDSSETKYTGIGGLVGENHDDGVITGCYSICAVTGGNNSYAGGLAGENSGNIVNSYGSGAVKGSVVGGLVGENSWGSSITSSYSTGRPSGWINALIGGLVGYNQGSVISSFWDRYTSSRSTSDGGIGKTTTQMQDIDTFLSSGWDFLGETTNGTNEIWRMCVDGVDYPRLSWEFAPADFVCRDGVDLVDFAHLANHWGLTGCNSGTDCGRADIDESGDVGLPDLAAVANDWLK